MEDLLAIDLSITPIKLAYIAFIGLIWGDFMGMMTVRTQKTVDMISKGIEPEKSGLKIFGGRSNCMSCKAQIPWYHNIPLLGWVHLRGRSSCCDSRISYIYPFTELFFSVAFLAAFYFLSPISATIFLICLSTCYVASYTDIKSMHIPIEGNYLLLIMSFLVMTTINPDPSDKVIYVLIAWIALHIINGISPQQVIGEGDIPIIISIILVSFSYLFNVAVLIASFVTIAIFVYNLIKHKNYSLARMVPFGPGLCVSYLVVLAIVLQEGAFA